MKLIGSAKIFYIIVLLTNNLKITNSFIINFQKYNLNRQSRYKSNNKFPKVSKIIMCDNDFFINSKNINKTFLNISTINFNHLNENNNNENSSKLSKFNNNIIINNNDNINNLNKNKNLIHLNLNNELNDDYDDDHEFPSFYEFLRKRELNEIKQKEEYITKYNNLENKYNKLNSEKNSTNYEKYNLEPTSKDLKLLTSFSTIEWARTWIYEMVHVADYFPTFMFQDMFRMRDFGQKNNSKNYFYIGYYPESINAKQGPYYIGAFELVPKNREFIAHIIIQNPYHCADNMYDKEKIMNFKKELLALCSDASVFFKFSNLKSTSDERYYYSWLYEE